MGIPGCALIFFHCISLGFTQSSFRAGISNYLVFEVGTFAFDYCGENEQVISKAQSGHGHIKSTKWSWALLFYSQSTFLHK